MGASKGTKPWNAGTSKPYLNQRGYLCQRVNGREVKSHRLAMEKHLGRKLEPWEHVHHLDGNKTNNAIENLAVITAEEHNKKHAGNQRSDSAKRTMAIYREMRVEIERLRKNNTEMLAALKQIEATGCDDYERVQLRALIAKAEGRQ